jgi:hypothetical protein
VRNGSISKAAWTVGALLAAAAPAAAQEPAFVAALAEIDRNVPAPTQAEMAPAALETLRAIAEKEKSCVPTGVAMQPAASASASRSIASMIGTRKIRNGWMAYGKPQGCPAKVPTRFLVLRMPDGLLIARVVNVGESLTAPDLMRASSFVVAVAAMAAIHKAHPECQGIEGLRMEETRVSSRSSDLGPDFHSQRYRGGWEEVWTFSQCGHRAEVPVAFVTDGQGGARWTAEERRARALD